MHWGHAESKDLIHWKEFPIALYPDSLGYIFSGSAVVDSNNTSGFGKSGKIPLIAIFTHHDPKGEREGRNDFQNESVAYSLDNGTTWTKYSSNPVLKNPGIRDFRDPKVMWYAPEKKVGDDACHAGPYHVFLITKPERLAKKKANLAKLLARMAVFGSAPTFLRLN